MLTVEIKINDRTVAAAKAQNVAESDTVGEYYVEITEACSRFNGGGIFLYDKITGHKRHQSAWALVEKIAALATKEQADAKR